MMRLISAGLISLILSVVHDDIFFSNFKDRKEALNLLIFSVVGVLTVQLTFLLTIEKSNAETAMVLQFLSPTISLAWLALVCQALPSNNRYKCCNSIRWVKMLVNAKLKPGQSSGRMYKFLYVDQVLLR